MQKNARHTARDDNPVSWFDVWYPGGHQLAACQAVRDERRVRRVHPPLGVRVPACKADQARLGGQQALRPQLPGLQPKPGEKSWARVVCRPHRRKSDLANHR